MRFWVENVASPFSSFEVETAWHQGGVQSIIKDGVNVM
jgi:hypothetical protein